MHPTFRNRSEAGRLLATQLQKYAGQAGVIAIGLPRGGVPVASEVAQRLNVPLDILVVRKLGVPCHEEWAMGAIAPDDVCVLNEEVIEQLDIESDAIGAVRQRARQELERRDRLYRGSRPAAALRGRTVIVVDDGIATGSTMHAAIMFLHQHGAARVVAAAPVIAPEAFGELKGVAAEVVAVIVPETLQSVSEWYGNFSPTTDEEVRLLLDACAPHK